MKKCLKIMLIAIFMVLFLTGCKGELLLEDVPVEFKGYDKEAYVLEGANEKVDVLITGEQDVLDKIEGSKNNKVVLDLDNYVIPSTGKTFDYKFETDIEDKFDSYEVRPKSAKVTLETKFSKTIEVKTKLIKGEKLPSQLGIKNVIVENSKVVIKGSRKAINNVSMAEVVVDLATSNIKSPKAYTYENLAIKYYDSNYEEVDDIEIETDKTNIVLEVHEGKNIIDVYSSKKVPVKVNLEGEPTSGTAISKIVVNSVDYDQYMVNIEGKGIDDILYLELDVDVSELNYSDSKVEYFSFAKSENIDKITFKGEIVSKLKVAVFLDEAKQKRITDVPIKVLNVPDGKTANIYNIEDAKSDVQVIGTESNLKDITVDDIELYVDIKYYSSKTYTGGYELYVRARSDNPLIQLDPVKSSIGVVISNK